MNKSIKEFDQELLNSLIGKKIPISSFEDELQLKSQQDSPDNVRRGMRFTWNTGSGYTFPPLPGSCPPGYS